jgi:aspartate aminotransferase
MAPLSSRIKNVAGSPTLKLNEKATQLRSEGNDVIHFGIGEPQNDLPQAADQAVRHKLQTGQVKYSATAGTDDLIEQVIDYTKEYYGKTPEHQNVMITIGAKQALFNLLLAILNPQDEVILLAPYWVSYPEMVKLAGGVPVPVLPDSSLVPDINDVLTAAGPKTRAIILNNPNNPAGVLYPEEFIAKLVDFCETRDIYLIMDDIYHQLLAPAATWVPGYVFSSKKINQTRIIVINGISKSFGMTGFRIGWLIANQELIQAVKKIQGHSTSGASDLLQAGAVGALSTRQQEIDRLSQQISRSREIFLSNLESLSSLILSPPGGTFYCFPDFSAYHPDSHELASLILEKAYVVTVPGINFGMEGYLRLSYAGPPERIREGIERIRWVVDPQAPREITIQGKTHICDWKRTSHK